MKPFFSINRMIIAKKGFTLIEIIVATAISAIIMASATSIFIVMYNAYESSKNQADAQNLCVLTTQKIADTVRYSNSVEISDTNSGDGIYYDTTNSTMHIGKDAFMKDAFGKYYVVLNFSDENVGKDNLLGIKIYIKSKNQMKTYYSMNSDIYLPNGKISPAGSSGCAVRFS